MVAEVLRELNFITYNNKLMEENKKYNVDHFMLAFKHTPNPSKDWLQVRSFSTTSPEGVKLWADVETIKAEVCKKYNLMPGMYDRLASGKQEPSKTQYGKVQDITKVLMESEQYKAFVEARENYNRHLIQKYRLDSAAKWLDLAEGYVE